MTHLIVFYYKNIQNLPLDLLQFYTKGTSQAFFNSINITIFFFFIFLQCIFLKVHIFKVKILV